MAEKEVVEFKAESASMTISNDNVPVEAKTDDIKKELSKADIPKLDEPKSFDFMGVKFPGYFQGPHFVQVKGSFVMAIDPACVSMEMRANWQTKYVKELSDLGKKVLEKNLHITIENLD